MTEKNSPPSESDDGRLPIDTTVDRRTLLKVVGATAVAGGVTVGSTGTAAATEHSLPIEIEGTLQSVDVANRQLDVLGTDVTVAENATITTPTATLGSLDALVGASFPGRSQPGFIGGTAVPVGTSQSPGWTATATEVFVEVAEHVIVGPVTENTVPPGGTLADGTFRVQGVNVEPIGDDRMPLVTIQADLGTEVDVGSVPEGSLAAVEGYLGAGGEALYIHTLEAEEAEIVGPEQLTINGARCASGRLRVRGASSEPSGTVTLYTHDPNNPADPGQSLETVDVEPTEVATLGEFVFDIRQVPGGCPAFVRAQHDQNGAEAISAVELR